MIYGYMRVSTEDQSLDLQRDALLRAGVPATNIYEEKASGKSTRKRPQLEACLSILREGDTLVCWKMDRLGRSVRDLKDIAENLADRGVALVLIQDKIDTGTAVGKLFFHMLAAFAEFERDVIAERTKAGLQAVRSRGVKLGRRPKVAYKPEEIRTLLQVASVTKVVETTGLSRSTVQRIARTMKKVKPMPEGFTADAFLRNELECKFL